MVLMEDKVKNQPNPGNPSQKCTCPVADPIKKNSSLTEIFFAVNLGYFIIN